MKNEKRIAFLFVMFLALAAFGFLFAGKPLQAKAIKLNKKTVYLAPKMTCKLKVKGTKKKVVWKSSNKKVATVSKKGKVKAKKTGTAVITAKVKGKKLKCKIIVEKKERNNARKLRDFIVKKGKPFKDADGKTYYKLEYSWKDNESNDHLTQISAYKDKTSMIFDYSLIPYTTACDRCVCMMNIDLIKKSSGRFDNNYEYSTDNSGYSCWGTITTAFDGKGTGLTVKAYYNVDSGGGETAVSNPSAYSVNIAKNYAKAFKEYDKLLKNKKTGQTMKSIGFKKLN